MIFFEWLFKFGGMDSFRYVVLANGSVGRLAAGNDNVNSLPVTLHEYQILGCQ